LTLIGFSVTLNSRQKLPDRLKADPPEGSERQGKAEKPRWYWACHPGRALSKTAVPCGVTRKGNAIPGD